MRYWEALLISWQNMGRNGLSIPFVIGSQEFLPDSYELQSVAELLEDIVQTERTRVCISLCHEISALILKPIGDQLPNNGFFPTHNGSHQGHVFVINLTELPDDMGLISEVLTERFEYEISHGLFSKRETGSYQKFNAADILFIKETFLQYELTSDTRTL
ncbi:MAG: hypothetical protein HOP08_19910 [Cyclobacteriaceae bacterium]|nr:hypothetical protein [Cyclobacteriaceae bacterium]